MRYSAAVLVAAASSAMAAPLLDKLLDTTSILGGGDAGDVTKKVGDVLHLVWTTAHADNLQSLSVLDGPGENILATTCGSTLMEGVFKSVPVDFSNLNENGVGNIVYGDVTYPVMEDATKAVSCVTKVTDPSTVVDCVVPVVAEMTLPIVGNLEEVASCLTSNLPLVGDLPALDSALSALNL